MNTQRGRAPSPEEMRQAKQKQTEQTNTEGTTKKGLATHRDKQESFHKRQKRKKTKTKHNQITFEAVSVVCGASSIDRCSYEIPTINITVSLSPYYPVCRLLPAFVNRGFRMYFVDSGDGVAVVPFRRCDGQNPKIQQIQYQVPDNTNQEQPRHPSTQTRLVSLSVREKTKETKTKSTAKSHSKQPQQFAIRVAETGSTTYLLLGLVPWYSTLSVIFLHSSTAVSLRLFLVPSPFHWTPPATDVWRFLLMVASFSCYLTMNRSAASWTSRYHLPSFFAATCHSAVSTPNTNGECSVDPSVARNTLEVVK